MQLVLIGGFTGMEKKNALFSVGNELIARGKKVGAVVIEDVQSTENANVDMDPAIIVKEMQNIPCTFITDLVADLQDIDKQPAFDHMLIEVPFSLPPGKVRKAIVDGGFRNLSVAPLVYMSDVTILKKDAKMIPKIVSTQIREAEIVFVSTGPLDQRTSASLNRLFETMNPSARIFEYSADSDGHRIGDLVDMLIS
ncbi:GTP-binding protein [Methanolobus sp. WCC5]|uniref:GTP-binding protein n=1 Tax=Methanolobus sp. WCC5 TaxID=3125785 RepID=UPI003255804A